MSKCGKIKRNLNSKRITVDDQSYWRFLNPFPYNDYFYPRLILFNQDERGFLGMKIKISSGGCLFFQFCRMK